MCVDPARLSEEFARLPALVSWHVLITLIAVGLALASSLPLGMNAAIAQMQAAVASSTITDDDFAQCFPFGTNAARTDFAGLHAATLREATRRPDDAALVARVESAASLAGGPLGDCGAR